MVSGIKMIDDKIESALKLQELINLRIKDDLELCFCISKKSCTYCRDRLDLESMIRRSKETLEEDEVYD